MYAGDPRLSRQARGVYPGSEMMKKLDSSKVLGLIGHEWIFPTVGEAVSSCDYVLHSHKPGVVMDSAAAHENMV